MVICGGNCSDGNYSDGNYNDGNYSDSNVTGAIIMIMVIETTPTATPIMIVVTKNIKYYYQNHYHYLPSIVVPVIFTIIITVTLATCYHETDILFLTYGTCSNHQQSINKEKQRKTK